MSVAARETASSGERPTLAVVRGALMVILVIGLVGLLAELLLLEHTEDQWQRLPIFCIVASLIILIWHAADRRALSLRFFQVTMALFVIVGGLGLLLHLKGNLAFELEMDPSAAGWPLMWSALKGATPTLAPGAMVQLGLIGLAYTFRHPALRRGRGQAASESGR